VDGAQLGYLYCACALGRMRGVLGLTDRHTSRNDGMRKQRKKSAESNDPFRLLLNLDCHEATTLKLLLVFIVASRKPFNVRLAN